MQVLHQVVGHEPSPVQQEAQELHEDDLGKMQSLQLRVWAVFQVEGSDRGELGKGVPEQEMLLG